MFRQDKKITEEMVEETEDIFTLRKMGMDLFLKYMQFKMGMMPGTPFSNPNLFNPQNIHGFMDDMDKSENDLLLAIRCFEKVVEIVPEFYFDWNQLGLLYLEARGGGILALALTAKTGERTKECFEKALELNPAFARGYDGLGTAYETLNDREKAFENKLKAVALQPQSSIYWNSLGLNYALRKELRKAIACYQRALELNPQNMTARRNLQSVMREASKI